MNFYKTIRQPQIIFIVIVVLVSLFLLWLPTAAQQPTPLPISRRRNWRCRRWWPKA